MGKQEATGLSPTGAHFWPKKNSPKDTDLEGCDKKVNKSDDLACILKISWKIFHNSKQYLWWWRAKQEAAGLPLGHIFYQKGLT